MKSLNSTLKKLAGYAKIAVITFLVLIVLGFIFNQSIANHFVPKVSYVLPQLKQSLISKYDMSGTIKAKQLTAIAFAEDVRFKEVYAQVGSKVKAGDKLFKLDTNSIASGNTKESQALSQRSVLNQLNAQKRTLGQEINNLNTKLNKQSKDIANDTALFNQGAIAKARLDATKQLKTDTENRLAAVRIQYNKVVSDIAIQSKKLKLITADDPETLENIYDIDADGICYAKTDGVLMRLQDPYGSFSKGQSVGEFAALESLDDVYFEMFVDSQDIQKLRLKQTLTFIDSKTDNEYSMRISGIDQVVSNNQIRVTADITKAKGLPFLNMKLTGEIVNRSDEFVTVIPKYTLINRHNIEVDSDNEVYVIEENTGVLGTEYVLRRLYVHIIGVGDDKVAIETIFERKNLPKLVSNHSHRLKINQRVLLMEN